MHTQAFSLTAAGVPTPNESKKSMHTQAVEQQA